MRIPTIKLLILTLCVAFLSGCNSVYRHWTGNPKPKADIAVLEHENAQHSFFIIEEVNGSWRGMGLITRYEFLPGEYSITASLHHPLYTSRKNTVWFSAEAGKTYIPLAAYYASERKWSLVVIDKASEQVVSYTKQGRTRTPSVVGTDATMRY